MELKKIAENLQSQMKQRVEEISLDQPDLLVRTTQIISCIESAILELKKIVLMYEFKNRQEEIEFFKTIKPVFVSQLWYHKRLFKIRLFESFNDSESRLRYYQHTLKSLQKFIVRNEEFYFYVFSNEVLFDERYFTRGDKTRNSFVCDDRFSTLRDNLLAKILCHAMVKDYVIAAIRKINTIGLPHSSTSSITWTASKTDLIELIYGLHAAGVFNKASSDLKQIATYFEAVFNVTLGNYYRTFQEIRIRKSGQTNFLDEMKSKLVQRIKEGDM